MALVPFKYNAEEMYLNNKYSFNLNKFSNAVRVLSKQYHQPVGGICKFR